MGLGSSCCCKEALEKDSCVCMWFAILCLSTQAVRAYFWCTIPSCFSCFLKDLKNEAVSFVVNLEAAVTQTIVLVPEESLCSQPSESW